MLKVIFGFLGLLVVLAIVSSLAKTQLGAIGQIGQTTTRLPAGADTGDGSSTGSMAGRAVGGARLDGFAATAGAEMPTAQQQIQGVQQSVRNRTADALQKGAQSRERATP